MRAPFLVIVVLGCTRCAPARPTHTEVVHDPPPTKHWCVDDTKCSPHLGHCLDICHKYNHPNGPKNDECDATCRHNYCERVEC